jgi:2'-5' RNA ligase
VSPQGGGTGSERVRLFVALELPPRVRDALARWGAQALRVTGGLRPLAEDHLHVTLCFLGWQAASEVGPLAAACAQVAACAPPPLRLGQPLWLPPRRPRVLAVRLEDSQGGLQAVQAVLSEHLQAGGWYQPEARAYLPHVTVARTGRHGRVSATPLPNPPALSFTGSQVTLFRSVLRPQGVRYEALAGVRLG